MALQKREKNLLGLMGLVAIAAIVYQFIIAPGADDSDNITKNPFTQIIKMSEPEQKITQVAALPEDAIRYKDWGRDPFSFYTADRKSTATGTASRRSSSKASQPELKGIFWSGTKAYALIDDAILTEGESEDGIRIQSIIGQEVTCYKNNKQYRLHWRRSP
ncbi:hypothetical protein KAR48_03955 [bacterium]|nr:hypothetical protein [bacterium]